MSYIMVLNMHARTENRSDDTKDSFILEMRIYMKLVIMKRVEYYTLQLQKSIKNIFSHHNI
jgi:hypothetical protein